MRIHHTIPRTVFEAYRCSAETVLLPNEQDRVICTENVVWDENIIPDLKILALRVIISVWKDNPILEELPTCTEIMILLETLSTDLPFELVITRIPDGHYWERAAKDRWQCNDPSDHGGSWRQLYCEHYLWEYLANLEASYFVSQQDECQKIIDLVQNYIHTIRLESLLPTRKTTIRSEEDPCITEEDIAHHIPMAIIIPQFPHLTEIYLSFQVIYMNDGFEWRDFEFSVEDCVSIGEGVKACPKLKTFALTRSNLDQSRVAAILQGMIANNSIEELDFSFCQLGDTGAHAVGEFLSMHKNLKILHLVDNGIGPNGLAGIIYGMLKTEEAPLKHLNLRLNPLQDAGGIHICALLLRSENLETLNMSGCELTAEGGEALKEVLGSGYMKIGTLSLDVSNNNFGPEIGETFANAMKSNFNVIAFDVRMCNFSKESEYSIYKSALR